MADLKYEFAGCMLPLDTVIAALRDNGRVGGIIAISERASAAQIIEQLRDERDALRDAILPGPALPNAQYVEVAKAVAADRRNAVEHAAKAQHERDIFKQERDALRVAIMPGARPGDLSNGQYVEAAVQTESARRGALERALKAETERDGLQARNDRQRTIIQDQDQQINTLRDHVTALRERITEMPKLIGSGKSIPALKDRIAELEAQIATANEALGRREANDYERWLSGELAAKLETIDRQSVAIERFKRLHDEALAKVSEITKAHETVVQDNNTLRRRIGTLRHRFKGVADAVHLTLDQTQSTSRSTRRRTTDMTQTPEQQQTIERLIDAIENLVIADTMAWDMDGVVEYAVIAARDAGSTIFADWHQRNDGSVVSPAMRDVLAERRRQVAVEGWTPEHDDLNGSYAMARAAACYAWAAGISDKMREVLTDAESWTYFTMFTALWPWEHRQWKPTTPRRDLVKAGALIIAEIERLDRAEARSKTEA